MLSDWEPPARTQGIGPIHVYSSEEERHIAGLRAQVEASRLVARTTARYNALAGLGEPQVSYPDVEIARRRALVERAEKHYANLSAQKAPSCADCVHKKPDTDRCVNPIVALPSYIVTSGELDIPYVTLSTARSQTCGPEGFLFEQRHWRFPLPRVPSFYLASWSLGVLVASVWFYYLLFL